MVNDDLIAHFRKLAGLGPDDELELMNPYRRALRGLTELRPALEHLEASLVDHARLSGTTWVELARDLGTSRQTAQRRHAGHDPIAARRRRLRAEWDLHLGG